MPKLKQGRLDGIHGMDKYTAEELQKLSGVRYTLKFRGQVD